MKFVASLSISVVLIAAASILYYVADRNETTRGHYRDSISLAHKIQQLDASWSVEAARVEADLLADFDALAAFIPQMSRLMNELTDTVRRIPSLPAQLANDINSYLSAMEAKEERVERFKTGYAVIRNSVRYLPLAAANLIRLIDDANDQILGDDVSRLTRDVNAYLSIPTQPEKERLAIQLETLRAASVTYPPGIANALANFIAHAEVLVARKIATDDMFAAATGADIPRRTERIVSAMEFEARRASEQAKLLELGVLGTLGAMVLLWGITAVFRFVEARNARPAQRADTAAPPGHAAMQGDDRPAAARAPPNEPPQRVAEPAPRSDGAAPVPWVGRVPLPAAATSAKAAAPARVPELAFGDRAAAGIDRAAAALPVAGTPPTREAKALHRIVTGFVSNNLTGHVHQIMARLDHLQQSQDRIRSTVGSGSGFTLSSGVDFEEEFETTAAVLSSIRRQVDDVGVLAARLETFAAQRDNDTNYALINIENCVNQACDAVRADTYAAVTKNFGHVPDIFASKFDILMLLEYILENAVFAVRELNGRQGVINIDVTRRNEEILVTVVDNGDGFEGDQKSKIFEPFYTTRGNALGIGLSAAVHLADKYHGTVAANSLPGEGTVFRITLPVGITGETTI